MTTEPRPVLHADFISLQPATPAHARTELVEAARALAMLDEVLSIALIEGGDGSEFELVLLFVLRDFRSLEPFGTDPRYSRFLQGNVAPILRELAGADIQLDGSFVEIKDKAACLALAAPPQTYDWEVRDLLGRWQQQFESASSVAGLAIGERQRFRGLTVVTGESATKASRPAESRFGVTLVAGEAHLLV